MTVTTRKISLQRAHAHARAHTHSFCRVVTRSGQENATHVCYVSISSDAGLVYLHPRARSSCFYCLSTSICSRTHFCYDITGSPNPGSLFSCMLLMPAVAKTRFKEVKLCKQEMKASTNMKCSIDHEGQQNDIDVLLSKAATSHTYKRSVFQKSVRVVRGWFSSMAELLSAVQEIGRASCRERV